MKRKKKNADGILYDHTGISQQALVAYTGANQSTLSKHLGGTRLLSGEAGLKLTNMELKVLRLPQQPLVQTLTAEEKERLKQEADWCRTQCIPLQQKLETMQKEAARASRLIQLVDALQPEETEMNDTRQRWYDSQRGGAEYKLFKNSRYEQIQLEVKIALLQKEAELYEVQLQEV